MKNKYFTILVFLLLCLPVWCYAQNEELNIAQVYQEFEDDTRLHVRIESAKETMPVITGDKIEQATVGTGKLSVLDTYSVSSSKSEGMRYVFILDHAMPISSERIKEMKKGMNEWIDKLGPKDAAAIFVAEDESVRDLTDGFIANHDELREAVENYGGSQERVTKSMLFSAIRDGILLASREDINLPQNCSIVICSNGLDTYQTLVTAEEISSMLKQNNLPMYVVGYAYQAQKEALSALVSMAKSSGGWAEDATPSNDQGTIDEAFSALRRRIQSGMEIVLDCSDGFVFNGPTQVSIRFKEPPVISRYTADLYLLKKEDKEESVRKPIVHYEEKQNTDFSEETNDSQFVNKYIFAIAVGVILLAVLITVIIKMVKAGRKEQPSFEEERDQYLDKEIEKEETAGKQENFSDQNEDFEQTVPVRGLAERESSISNQKGYQGENDIEQGKVSRMLICYQQRNEPEIRRELSNPTQVTIGRDEGNTIVLKSTSVSSKHARITCLGERVYIENVSGQCNPLFVNGHIVNEKTEMNNDSHLTVGNTGIDVSWNFNEKISTLDTDATLRATDIDFNATVRIIPIVLTVSYELNGETKKKVMNDLTYATIGRAKKDTVMIPDPSVSRHHVRLYQESGIIWVKNESDDRQDVGRNPFYYRNESIIDQIPFEDGMTIKLGNVPVTIYKG